MPQPSDWTIRETKRLRMMDKRSAEVLMDDYHIPQEQRVALRELVGTSPHTPESETALESEPEVARFDTQTQEPTPPPPDERPSSWRAPDPDRPLWFAAAWLLGASYAVLAGLHNITPQAVQQSVNRLIGVEHRHANRMGYRLVRAQVEELRVLYYENVTTLRGMTPTEAAKFLRAEWQREE